MSLESSLRNLILQNEAIANVVGDKVRPLNLAQADTPPFVTYQIRKGETDQSLSGGVSDYRNAEIELGIYSPEYDDVADLSEHLQTLLDGYGETHEGIEFAPIQFTEETDIEQTAPEGDEFPYAYVRVQTYSALYANRS